MSEPARTDAVSICTIVSANYFAHARSLIESYLEHHPDGRAFVLLVDRVPEAVDLSDDRFVLTTVEELGLPNLDALSFRSSVTEFNTAVKPTFLRYLMREHGLAKVCYFDPDIIIYRRLDELSRALDTSEVFLTPHLLAPLGDDKLPTELNILQAGTYNLGFIGVSSGQSADDLLRWWEEKLLAECSVDVARGIFVDQRWIDFAPSLFTGVEISRDPGYNVAYWNLGHRKVVEREGAYCVNHVPLKFFHFSGFSPQAVEVVSKHQNRFRLVDLGDEQALFWDYRKRLLRNGFEEVSKIPYAFGYFDDGVLVPDVARHLWSDEPGSDTRWPTPFAVSGPNSFRAWLNEPAEESTGHALLITRLAMEIYRIRADLRRAFPDVFSQDRHAFVAWFVQEAARAHSLAEIFIQPMADGLEQYLTNQSASPAMPAPAGKPADEAPQAALLMTRLRAQAHVALVRASGMPQVQKMKMVLPPRQRAALRRALFRLVSGRSRATQAVVPAPHSAVEAQGIVPAVALPPGINVVGYLGSETGVGEVGRGMLRAVNAAGAAAAYTTIELGDVSRKMAFDSGAAQPGAPFDVNLMHVNADQVPVVAEQLGDAFFANRRSVGFWFWELDTFPEEWTDRFALFDEIWVASQFGQATIAAISPIPVVRMRPVIDLPEQRRPGRADFGLPDDRKVFLYAFDALSIPERKNPLGLVRAFRQAFGSASNEACLVLKINNLKRAKEVAAQLGMEEGFVDTLRKEIASVSGILLEDNLDRASMIGLIDACDAYVSPHRCEGFGLSLAEAMFLGKPTIGTGYSANVDFMNPANSYLIDYQPVELERDYGPYRAGRTWAQPDEGHLASLLRRIVDEPDEAGGKAAVAAGDIRRLYGPAAVGAAVCERLAILRSRV
ncbi:MAG: hypothetical protein VCC00_10145 [Deltaproteobacteria bacterium]